MDKKPTIGFIGLGIMGLAMAKNAKAAGFPVVAFNRSEPRRQEAREAGLIVLETPRDVADQAAGIVVMVTDPKAVQQVLFGDKGILSGAVRGKTLLQMSTLDVKSTVHFSRDCAENGMEFLDVPVTGSKAQVDAAQLILLVGGKIELIDRWRPFLMSVGKAVVHAGEIGKGTALKLCMNLIVAEMTSALCESTALAKVLGVNQEKVFEVIGHSPALNCGYYKIKQYALLNEDFAPAFSLGNMLKDVRFMEEAAREHRLMLPVLQAVKFLMEGAAQEGLSDEDLVSISKLLRPRTANL